MIDKKTTRSKLIASYLSRSAERRSNSPLNNPGELTSVGVKREGGKVTVLVLRDAKPISKLGGPSKIFGKSRISIPEFKRSR